MPTSKKEKLFTEYYDLHDEYAAKYGEKVAILMQVGKFFELYAPADYSRSSNFIEVTSLINCNITWKETERMSGFPLNSLEKNMRKLTDNDYTVIVVEQITTPVKGSKSRVERKITKVYSKGTLHDNVRVRNNILSIFYKKYPTKGFSFGIAAIDDNISTDIHVHDIHSGKDDKGFALDTAIRFVAQYDPVECIIVTKNGDSPEDVQKHLSLTCPVFHRDVQMIDREHLRSAQNKGYSEEVLYSLAALKTFLAEHSQVETTVQYNIVPFRSTEVLDLCSTALKQLDIPKFISCQGKINMTMTPMGKRLLCDRMYMPTKNVTELEARYDAIDSMTEHQCKTLRSILKDITDVGKTHKHMANGNLSWGQFATLHEMYLRVKDILKITNNQKLLTDVDDLVDSYSQTIDIESLSVIAKDLIRSGSEGAEEDSDTDVEDDEDPTTMKKRRNIFRQGIHGEVDSMLEKMSSCADVVSQCSAEVTKLLPKWKGVKIKDNIGFKATAKRAEDLKKLWPEITIFKVQKQCIVYTEHLRQALCQMKTLEEDIDKCTTRYFSEFQKQLYTTFSHVLDALCACIAETDFIQSAFMMKTRLRLTRPNLITNGKRVLRIKGVRHLLIEHINQDTRYIPNDCFLGDEGSEQSEDQFGMVLYGVNSCGKTSYLKSVGLAVVMAQAGLFVPAENMTFSPFSTIMTRIAGTDNMERSQSSYIVELEELLSVIRRGDEETLVLGDEICRGTEVDSANAMVYTTFKWMLQKRIFFIAATHLHSIANRISAELSKCKVYHMKVTFDEDGDIVYDRQLAAGPGPERYGLEIARVLGFPKQFMEEAFAYRQKETAGNAPTLVTRELPSKKTRLVKKSRYNANKILVRCQNPECNYEPKDVMHLPLDTHHIQFQCNADQEGFHGSQHMNALHNLVCVCKQCHCKIHEGKLEVICRQKLSGPELIFKNVELHKETAQHATM